MTEFQKITASPEALTELLASILTADGPWDRGVGASSLRRLRAGGLRRLPA